MGALLIFHLKAGGRIAIRSFAPLFSSILALIMLNIDAAGAVTGLATAIFARSPALAGLLLPATLAFLLPAWASPKLAHGLNGWMRHLAFDSNSNRRGMALALVTVQMPLAAALACLAFVAHTRGLSIALPSFRWLLVLLSGASASLPVRRRFAVIPLSAAAALLSLRGDWSHMLPAMALLLAADVISGPLREARHRNPWRGTGSLQVFRIAWRALGWRISNVYVVALVPLAAMALFIRNNEPPPHLAAGAARLGGSMAVAIVLAGLAGRLAVRRPAWPLARSFPWSSAQRVASDALFVGLHALLPVFLLAVRYPRAAVCVLALLPVLALRAAGYIRQAAALRTGTGRFLLEGFALAALLALLPWMSLPCLAAAPLAFIAARQSECSLKVTRWSDLHHAPFGDTLSWSE